MMTRIINQSPEESASDLPEGLTLESLSVFQGTLPKGLVITGPLFLLGPVVVPEGTKVGGKITAFDKKAQIPRNFLEEENKVSFVKESS